MKKYIDLEIDWEKYPWASCAAQDRSGAIHVFETGADKDLITKTWKPKHLGNHFEFVRNESPNKWWINTYTLKPKDYFDTIPKEIDQTVCHDDTPF